jgi:NADPH-dependent glutamate synthase beta subunit-like oxidoreductase/ferredoxin/Pyruvate/2-oxoacid:ferredoxin oxidoreductase delta subunit
MKGFALNIDGRTVPAEEGQTVLDAALKSGIYIPHLCHHPDLKPVGACRLCIVEIEGIEGLPPSCLTAATDGMTVKTRSDGIDRMRRLALELLLADHPPECLACSKYLNCELQSVKQYLGISEELRVRRRIKPIPAQTGNPLFVHDFARCIRCGRCVRACHELRGIGVVSFLGRGQETRIGTAFDRSLAEAGCRFCGACAEVCPTGAIRDREELVKGRKRREALVPCQSLCPAEIDVPRYLRFIREKKFAEAVAVVREKAPFPKVLGYICNHPCEEACRRGEVNSVIAIKELKRFAAEHDTRELWPDRTGPKPSTGKRVAVIGSGPAGLTAAYYLAKQGHAVNVLEALPLAGGMLRVGIPAYRLPREVVDEEVRQIRAAGVDIQTNTPIKSPERLLEEGFDAVVAAIGAHQGQILPLPGADLKGVLVATDFLRAFHLGKAVSVGDRVVVLGGGNVAWDCARVTRRLGAREVHLVCLEAEGQLPASAEEILEGLEEGLVLHPSRSVAGLQGVDGNVAGLEILQVASLEFDTDGRPRLETLEGSAEHLPADTVIFAIGQKPEIPAGFDLETDDRGRITVDPYTLETSREGVFAIGDAVTGTASVIEAIAAGRRAASAVDRFLGGNGDIAEAFAPLEKPASWLGPGEGFAACPRVQNQKNASEQRLRSFETIVLPLDDAQGLEEAQRCLQCDLRLKISPVNFWGDY